MREMLGTGGASAMADGGADGGDRGWGSKGCVGKKLYSWVLYLSF
jgi:hypothetical protein